MSCNIRPTLSLYAHLLQRFINYIFDIVNYLWTIRSREFQGATRPPIEGAIDMVMVERAQSILKSNVKKH